MAEVIEVKELPEPEKAVVVKVKSLEDLKRIADLYQVPLILKKDKDHYTYVEGLRAAVTYRA